jgi:hypothetical protein
VGDIDREDFAQFQIAASEALRAGCAEGLDADERELYFHEAAKWAGKAFVAARDNVFSRLLALSQYESAWGMILLCRSNYDAMVINVEEPTH